jgi:hypothetical protein
MQFATHSGNTDSDAILLVFERYFKIRFEQWTGTRKLSIDSSTATVLFQRYKADAQTINLIRLMAL